MTKAEHEARKEEDAQIIKMIRAKALDGDGLALIAFALLEVARDVTNAIAEK
jgi:hypothetical protein